jgi:hypothetical protein
MHIVLGLTVSRRKEVGVAMFPEGGMGVEPGKVVVGCPKGLHEGDM